MMFRLPVDGTPELDAAGARARRPRRGGQSGRLNRRLVRDEQIAQSVSGGALPLIGGVSFGTLTGIASDGVDLQQVEDALVEEIEKLAADGVTADELATVQAQAERDWLEQLATCAGRADEISHHALLFGDANRINTRIDQVRAVTAEQVQAGGAASGSAPTGRAAPECTVPPQPKQRCRGAGMSSQASDHTAGRRAAAAVEVPGATSDHATRAGTPVHVFDRPGQYVATVRVTIAMPLIAEPRELEGVATIMSRTLDEGTELQVGQRVRRRAGAPRRGVRGGCQLGCAARRDLGADVASRAGGRSCSPRRSPGPPSTRPTSGGT